MRCVGTTDKYKRGRVLRRPEEKELKFARAGLENTEFLHFLKLKFCDWYNFQFSVNLDYFRLDNSLKNVLSIVLQDTTQNWYLLISTDIHVSSKLRISPSRTI
jgi:hypothetical protein